MKQRVTLSYQNKFVFTCPIFNARTSMGMCMLLRDMQMSGRGTTGKRVGCQAAMRCGKCPAAALVSMHIYDKTWDNDFHGSVEPKEGKLHAKVLAKVERVMMQDRVMNEYGVSPRERDLLMSASDRIREQLKTAPGEAPDRQVYEDDDAPRKPRKSTAAPAPKATSNAIAEAAKSGDLAAAINA